MNLIISFQDTGIKWKKKVLERQALGTIEKLLKNNDNSSHIRDKYPHSYNYAAAQRNRIDIFTNNRLGNFSYNDKEILEAQRYYKKAVDRFENIHLYLAIQLHTVIYMKTSVMSITIMQVNSTMLLSISARHTRLDIKMIIWIIK